MDRLGTERSLEGVENVKSVVYMAREIKQKLRQQTGVSFGNYEIMMAPDAAGGACRIGELAIRIQRDAGAVTTLVDYAENSGFVVRERSTKDRRVVMIRLVNPEALARAEAFMAAMDVPEIVTDFFVEVVKALDHRPALAAV